MRRRAADHLAAPRRVEGEMLMKKLLLVLLTSTSLLCNSAYASTDREICENPNSSKADRIQACTRLIEANPKDADAYYHRGSNFVGLRNQPEMAKRAIQDLTRAINLGGLTEYRPALAYFFRSVLFDEAGEYDKAIADASELIKLKTHFSNGGAYLIRGDLYMK